MLVFFFPKYAFAGWFSMDMVSPGGNTESTGESLQQTNEIQVLDKTDKLIQRRREEAHKLIAEGNKMIIKGEKRKDQSLIIKGKIKKEIGEKQLKLLKGQVEQKKEEDEKDGW